MTPTGNRKAAAKMFMPAAAAAAAAAAYYSVKCYDINLIGTHKVRSTFWHIG
jgi:hypothetical protein